MKLSSILNLLISSLVLCPSILSDICLLLLGEDSKCLMSTLVMVSVAMDTHMFILTEMSYYLLIIQLVSQSYTYSCLFAYKCSLFCVQITMMDDDAL